MAWTDFFSNFSLGSFSFGFNFTTIASAAGSILILFWIVYFFGNRSIRRGPRAVRRELKELGWSPMDVEGHSGRGLLKQLTSDIAQSLKARILAKIAGKQAGKIGQDFANSTSAVITGEAQNAEEALEQAGTAAAALNLERLIMRPINTDLKEDVEKREIEIQISQLTSRLADISSPDEINEQAAGLISATGMQMISAYIKLAYDENLELNMRRKSFAEAYNKTKVIDLAEKIARRVENNLFKNQQKISKFMGKELKDLEKYLKDMLKEEGRKIKALREAYGKATDNETRAALYNQIADAQKSPTRTAQNAMTLLQALEQLKATNVRMMQNIERVYHDIKSARSRIKDAEARIRFLESAEKSVDSESGNMKAAAKTAEFNFREMQKSSPEFIIITLSGDTAAILSSMIKISETIVAIDEKQLIEFMNSLKAAIESAYQAEESTRIANRYYASLLQANEAFYKLVLDMDLSQELKDEVLQEIQIDKMEEQIASREEKIEQATKTLFIKSINQIDNSIGAIENHVLYLKELIKLTERTRRYTLEVLSWLMHIISERKSEMGTKFAAQAMQYQAQLDKVTQNAGLARRAAAPAIPLQQAA